MELFQAEMNGNIYCTLSGAAVGLPADIESLILNAKLSGTAAREAFISDRLRKNKQFFELIEG